MRRLLVQGLLEERIVPRHFRRILLYLRLVLSSRRLLVEALRLVSVASLGELVVPAEKMTIVLSSVAGRFREAELPEGS